MRGRRDFLTLGIAGLWLATACGCDVVSTAPKAAQTTAEPPSRGALPPMEQATVDLFKEVRPSVAYITTLTQRRNLFTGVATEIPRGTGSGFVWDEAGHVVTNLHVLHGATAAQVVLHDQSTHRAVAAKLVGDQSARDIALAFQQLPEEPHRGATISTRLHEDIERAAILVHRPPEVLPAAVERGPTHVHRSELAVEDVVKPRLRPPFVRSIKEECLSRVVPLGEGHLRLLVREYVEHYHRERNHQGLDNQLLQRPPPPVSLAADVRRRARLGGLLNFYHREAA